MAHPQTAEAVDAPVDDMDSAAAAIGRLMGDTDDPRDEEQHPEGEEDQSENQDDDLDLSEDEEGEDDEAETPPIEAPASLTAEEKTKFAALPKEAQAYVVELEGRRASQVQTATTKAAEAQRNAEASAARADAQAKAVYAQQLKTFADHLAPQMPPIELAHTDPTAYNAMFAQYTAARAQHDEFVQQVQSVGEEAQESMTQAEIAERDRFLMTLPEVQNETTRGAFFEKAMGAAKRVGLDVTALNSATGGEWKALREIADAFDKADKYDSAMTRQMQRVREGKKVRTTKPNAAQPSSSEGRSYREAKQQAARTGDVKDAARAIAALG